MSAARRDKLEQVAKLCEGGTKDQQRFWLIEAFEQIFERDERKGELRLRFSIMLDAEAWESAAMTLVPEGWHIGQLEELWQSGRWRCRIVQRPSDRQRAAFDDGRTIGLDSQEGEAVEAALAISAAACRAQAKDLADG